MNYHPLPGIIVSGLLFFVSVGTFPTGARATEGDELRDRAKAIGREANELARQGRVQEAEALKREALKLMEAAGRGRNDDSRKRRTEIDQGIEKLEKHRAELRERLERLLDGDSSDREVAEAKERFAAVQRELEQAHVERQRRLAHAEHGGNTDREREIDAKIDAKIDAEKERIEHVTIAADHLEKAGMGDFAEQLRSKAASMEQNLAAQIRRAREIAAHEHHVEGHDHERGGGEVSELRELVKRLQAELRELREHAERR